MGALGRTLFALGDGLLSMGFAGGAATGANARLCLIEEAVGGGADLWLAVRLWRSEALGMTAVGQRLCTLAANLGDIHLSGHDPHYGQTLGVNCHLPRLFTHPLAEALGVNPAIPVAVQQILDRTLAMGLAETDDSALFAAIAPSPDLS
jgi:hypothetical protein